MARPSPNVDRVKIARLLKRRPTSGFCCFEVEELLNLSHQTASARLHDLEKRGYIKRQNRRRPTPLGGLARPYVVRGYLALFSMDQVPNVLSGPAEAHGAEVAA